VDCGAQIGTRIAPNVELIRKEYDKPLRIAGLARRLGMSTSGLHHDFKTVTAMSPLQLALSTYFGAGMVLHGGSPPIGTIWSETL
jgi:AraC-like DNA-binding protein